MVLPLEYTGKVLGFKEERVIFSGLDELMPDGKDIFPLFRSAG